MLRHTGSPVSDDGRGLKRRMHEEVVAAYKGSPVSDDGRGLKHVGEHRFGENAAGFARQ